MPTLWGRAAFGEGHFDTRGKALSLSGGNLRLGRNDIAVHGGDPETAVRKVRNWISGLGDFERIGPTRIFSEYEDFYKWYYERQRKAGFSRTRHPGLFDSGTLEGDAPLDRKRQAEISIQRRHMEVGGRGSRAGIERRQEVDVEQ